MKRWFSPALGLCAWVLCAAVSASASAETSDGRASDADALRVPTDADVAQLWRDVLADGDSGPIYDGYKRLDGMWPQDGEVDREACVDQRDALDADLRANPVGMALWWVSSLCAQAMGDEARADRDAGAFAVLVRAAMAPLQPGALQDQPIRILSELDVYALVEVSGQQLLYSYYDPRSAGRHLLLHVVLWDESTQRERVLVFDYLDIMARLQRTDPAAEAPVFRFAMARELINLFGSHAGTPGQAGMAMREAFDATTPEARVAAFRDASERGLTGVITELGRSCIASESMGCADAAVDALLPLAEQQRLSHALILLAVANSTGRGVEIDPAAAIALLDAADRELGGTLGSQVFLGVMRQSGLPLPSSMRERLQALAGSDDVVLALFHEYLHARDPAHRLPADAQTRLCREGVERPSYVAYTCARLLPADRAALATRWLHVAAEAGLLAAQLDLADAYRQGQGVVADADRARHWYEEAGRGGSLYAIQHVARDLLQRGEGQRAQFWMESAKWFGDRDASYEYARLAAHGEYGATRDPAEAIRVLRTLVGDDGAVRERHLLADLLLHGHGGWAAAQQAEVVRLLQTDIARGNARSMGVLGIALFHGRLPAHFGGDGAGLLRRGATGGDPQAMNELGMLIYTRQLDDAPSSALHWLSKAADAGFLLARNNLAWVLCVAGDEALYDPAAGRWHADLLARASNLPPGYIDTLAACDAANGKFSRAVRRQEEAMALMKQRGGSDAAIEAYRERMRLFQRGETVRESFAP